MWYLCILTRSTFVMRPLRREFTNITFCHSTVPRNEYRYFAFLSILRVFKTVSVDVRYTMEQISIANIYCFIRRRKEMLYFRCKSKWNISRKCVSISSRVLNLFVVKRENILVRNSERVKGDERKKRRGNIESRLECEGSEVLD